MCYLYLYEYNIKIKYCDINQKLTTDGLLSSWIVTGTHLEQINI